MWERTRGTGGGGGGGGSPGRIQGRDTGGGKRKGTVEVGILKGREGEEIKLGEIRQHRLILPNRKSAEVAGKSRKKRAETGNTTVKGAGRWTPAPVVFVSVVSLPSPIFPFLLLSSTQAIQATTFSSFSRSMNLPKLRILATMRN